MRPGRVMLTENEKAEVQALIAAGKPLPERYRWKLFEQPRETELIWPGKTGEVTNVVLPFQTIEQIDEPRAETSGVVGDLFQMGAGGRQSGGWSNKLIWGDNKLVLSSLKNGPLRKQIEDAGGLKLVYIDPPFDVGADFSIDIDIGGENFTKEPSAIEDIAYRDTWGRGSASYLSMIKERLLLLYSLISDDGSIYIHLDSRVSHHVRILLDEVFGIENQIAEVIFKRRHAHSDAQTIGNISDYILIYSKSEKITWNAQYTPYTDEYIKTYYRYKDPNGRKWLSRSTTAPGGRGPIYLWNGVKRAWRYTEENMKKLHDDGRLFYTENGMPRYKQYLDEMPGAPITNIWNDLKFIDSWSSEDQGYPTQKPETLLERIISASTDKNDLVADFFCGSGTTLVVAEKLGRKWIGCDLGRFAIHTARKRLIGVQRELKAQGKLHRSFEILNLGKYERQFFAGIDPTLPDAERRAQSARKEDDYLTLILSAYKAERVRQTPPFHGRKGSTLVHVGPVDAPITRSSAAEAVDAALALGVSSIDCIGFEFEMGLIPQAVEDARAKGVRLALKYIPKDVFDKRAIDKNQVVFYDVAYVEVQTKTKGLDVTVSLSDFGVSYRQEDADVLASEMKAGGSKVTVDQGQVVKISKDKAGVVTREVLTKQWTDWIDYWSVDFDYHSTREIITVTTPDATGRMVDRPQWTGGHVFENEWQSFRTRRDRKLELTSAPHTYPAKGKYAIAVKVIDIFGNDTTKVVEVTV